MLHPIRDTDSDEVKQAKRTQEYVLREIAKSESETAEELRQLSQQYAMRRGALYAVIDAALEPGMTLVSKCGASGGGTTLPDGRYMFVSVGSDHYGFREDRIEITLCAGGPQYTEEQKKELDEIGYEKFSEKYHTKFKISAPCRKLDFNAVAMAFRKMADMIDSDQYMHGANTDFATFANLIKQVTPESK